MEALTDDIVYSLSAYLRPRDLANLALASRRFGGSPGDAFGADAERVAKRRRIDGYGAEKTNERTEGVGRNAPLMDEVARRLVEGHSHFSSELLQRQGGESWMKALHRLQGHQQLIEEAMAAAPAIFAEPGDTFRLRDVAPNPLTLQYVDRYKDGCPSHGWRRWLVFHNLGDDDDVVNSLGLLQATGMYGEYIVSGVWIGRPLFCVPPEKCGVFGLVGEVDDDEGVAIGQRSIKERLKELCIQSQMIAEAKEAAPALVAKPGDLFEWKQNPERGDSVILRFVGRNEVPPVTDSGGCSTPKLGWLVFQLQDERDGWRVGGIRDGLGAWPLAAHSHFDDSGKMIGGTLCIPPEKCGAMHPMCIL